MKIKNLILDLGGVLYDLDYDKTKSSFQDLGIANNFSRIEQLDIIDEIEEGLASKQDFINVLRERSTLERKPSSSAIIEAWNSMLLGIRPKQFVLLEQLKEKYNMYLYSNTNEIHIEAVWEHLKSKHGYSNLDAFFLKVYLSNEMQIRKPKVEGFDLIVSENSLVKEETLFIDDSPQHVEGAIKSGINAFWLDLKEHDLKSLLESKDLL